MTLNNNMNDVFAVKVSFGDDIRRATCPTSYEGLKKMVVEMFNGMNEDTLVLKYQDEDGDKITMTTDGELREAIRISHAQKVVRMFAEIKQTKEAKETLEAEIPTGGFECWRGSRRGRFGFHGMMPYGFPHGRPCQNMRGGRAGWAGFGGRDFHSRCPPGFFPHPHPAPHHPVPESLTDPVVPQSAPSGEFPAPHHPVPESVATPLPPQGAPYGEFPHPHPYRHRHHHPHPSSFGCGSFFPAADEERAEGEDNDVDVESEIQSFKEKKHAMKETIAAMKASARTDEDWEKIKAYKKLIKETWKDLKGQEKCKFKKDKKDKKDKKERKYYAEKLMAKHVADVSIPDHSELPPNTPVVKTWRLKNAGMVAWPVDSQLILVSKHGDTLHGPLNVPVGTVQPGQEVDVSVPFVTPGVPGRYVAYYRMATGDGGYKFGQRVWVTFAITGIAPNATAPTTTTTTTTSMVL